MIDPISTTLTAHPSAMTYSTARIFNGDCRLVMSQLDEAAYDLVFADPPFNIGHPYDGYDDSMTSNEYEEFTRQWLYHAYDRLRPGGVICTHVPDDVVPLIFRYLPMGLTRIDWIIWHYRFGQSGNAAKSTKCINSKAHLLVFAKGGRTPTWNPPMVPSDRATKYGDKRTAGSETPGMRVALDVWGVPSDGPYWGRVQGNNVERWDKAHGALVDHPNQLPEVYVERAMLAWSNEGDQVLCPFGGSGTETVVAKALHRSIDTIEFSETSCGSIAARLVRGAVRVGKGKPVATQLESEA